MSVIVFVVLVGLSIWLDRQGESSIGWCCSACLLRLVALLGLTLGLGVGYMIGRRWRLTR